MDRTSSMGLWTYSHNFYIAAFELVRAGNAHTRIPSYYLVAHSIELSLKAFLRGHGVSLEELSSFKKFGHNLERCISTAIECGLETFTKIDENDRIALAMINEYYQGKELEYIKTGYKEFPPIDLLLRFADKILSGIRQFCFDQRNLHA